jgi:hypothetical protein
VPAAGGLNRMILLLLIAERIAPVLQQAREQFRELDTGRMTASASWRDLFGLGSNRQR